MVVCDMALAGGLFWARAAPVQSDAIASTADMAVLDIKHPLHPPSVYAKHHAPQKLDLNAQICVAVPDQSPSRNLISPYLDRRDSIAQVVHSPLLQERDIALRLVAPAIRPQRD